MLIGTWNLENLYRPGGEYGPRDEAAYEAKLASLAAVVDRLAPDLLGVQEVGEPEALDDLVQRLGGGWHTALSSLPDGRGIRVGFLARTPLEVIADRDGFPARLRPVQSDDGPATTDRMGRGALAIRTESPERRTVEAVVCHLKSKLLSYPGGRFNPRDEGERARFGAYALYRRAAEAATVRGLADELLEGQGVERPVVVLGDLNDAPGAATTQILLGPPGSEFGSTGFERPDRGDAFRLWNTAPLIPEKQRFSRIHAGHRELIDHILLSHALAVHAEAAGTGTHTGAGTGAGAGTGHERLPDIGESPVERRDTPGSDHAPVWVRLAL
ncbi:endonuclease/exonuclease/phosphatase family protein [Streptomyces sp. GC420]|uniref:endonuclease/exonuclease/phosphatase family protein n=1 Tax=Streptomyces sp. GC420 TaxID=2697568 RepID=UPI001414DA96|nr:endonuclease/exonuclease/phosphatase family protein [Streptomyces sp. GC420]NBM17941.1 endonuclease [Streptomyces sp. GC420]